MQIARAIDPKMTSDKVELELKEIFDYDNANQATQNQIDLIILAHQLNQFSEKNSWKNSTFVEKIANSKKLKKLLIISKK
jgi:hypothetical protein